MQDQSLQAHHLETWGVCDLVSSYHSGFSYGNVYNNATEGAGGGGRALAARVRPLGDFVSCVSLPIRIKPHLYLMHVWHEIPPYTCRRTPTDQTTYEVAPQGSRCFT